MKIVHYKKTNIASAPDELSKCLNKYSNKVKSELVFAGELNDVDYDLIHFHNKINNGGGNFDLIQYHSEPFRVNLNSNFKKKLVIGQYHATLPEYENCIPVKNTIDFQDNELYKENIQANKFKVGFSPSVKTNNGFWFNKGYRQTKRVLSHLKSEFSDKFDFDIIKNVSLDECLKRKRECNIIIDECVTPSYHRSGLEGLAMGKMTICSISDEVKNVITEMTGSPLNPFKNIKIENLYDHLSRIIKNKDIGYVIKEGKMARKWMENFWHPEDIVQEFEEIYESLL